MNSHRIRFLRRLLMAWDLVQVLQRFSRNEDFDLSTSPFRRDQQSLIDEAGGDAKHRGHARVEPNASINLRECRRKTCALAGPLPLGRTARTHACKRSRASTSGS
jgi:hypothetical protein